VCAGANIYYELAVNCHNGNKVCMVLLWNGTKYLGWTKGVSHGNGKELIIRTEVKADNLRGPR
jgi:hypothetical protein